MAVEHTYQTTVRRGVFAAGLISALLIGGAAAALVARDHGVAMRQAESHLDNFTAVLAERTRFVLAAAREDVRSAVVTAAADAGSAARARGFFARAYTGLGMAYAGRILIFRADGTLASYVPWEGDVAPDRYKSLAATVTERQSGSSAVIRGTGLIGSEERLFAYRRVEGYPLVVVVSAPMSEVLKRWWRDSMLVLLATMCLGGIIGIATWLLARQVRLTAVFAREAEENETRLNSIIGSAMDAIITIDEEQRVVLFNAAAEKIFRCPAAEAIGSRIDRFIPERFRAAHQEHVQRFGRSGDTTRLMGAQLVLAGQRSDGEEFPIDASISSTTVSGRTYYTVILRDVTARQRGIEAERLAQLKLAQSESRLNSIISSAMDAIITIDEAQQIVMFNTAAERIFGCSAGEAVGTRVERFIPQRFRGAHSEHVRRFGEAGVTTRRMGGNFVLTGLRVTGEEFPIDASISHVSVGTQRLFTVILRDITERQHAADALARSNDELRQLYESMHHVREAERTRIARELHDELAQWLTALKMDAAWIAARLAPDQEALARKAAGMKTVVDGTVTAVRRIAADLRPVMLDDLGLIPALEALIADLSERGGVGVTLDVDRDDLELKEPLATALYRMVQEALTNVARHANARAAIVELRVKGEKLHVRVRDDGDGFNPDASRKTYGLLGIRERARTLGGSARIYSPDTGGTIVDIELPLELNRTAGMAA